MADAPKSAGFLDRAMSFGTNGLGYVYTLARGVVDDRSAVADRFRNLAVRSRREGVPWLDNLSLLTAVKIRPDDAKLRTDLGALYFEKGAFDAARSAFAGALDRDHANVVALRGMGTALHRQGKLAEAAYYYLSCLSQDPNDVQVLLNLGMIFEAQGQYAEAIKRFETVLRIDPDHGLAHRLLGRTLRSNGHIDASKRVLERTVELMPSDSETHRQLGHTLEAAGEKARAVKEFERAVELDPENALAHLNLAQLLNLEDDSPERVILEAERARELFDRRKEYSGVALASWEIGWAEYRLGHYERSIAASRRALEIQPANLAVRFNLGVAQLRKGDAEAARDTYETALIGLDDFGILKTHGIADLKEALEEEPDLPGGSEILGLLEDRRDELLSRLRAAPPAMRA